MLPAEPDKIFGVSSELWGKLDSTQQRGLASMALLSTSLEIQVETAKLEVANALLGIQLENQLLEARLETMRLEKELAATLLLLRLY